MQRGITDLVSRNTTMTSRRTPRWNLALASVTKLGGHHGPQFEWEFVVRAFVRVRNVPRSAVGSRMLWSLRAGANLPEPAQLRPGSDRGLGSAARVGVLRGAPGGSLSAA